MRCFLYVAVVVGMGTQRAIAQSRDTSLPSLTVRSGEAQLFVDIEDETGGFITAASEVAFYGKSIEPMTFEEPLSASGTMGIGPGGTHLLLGFFNSGTVNEWRTPNTVAIRLNGRGENFFAYVEYGTSKWRAGGDTTPFPSVTDPTTGRWNLIGFPCNQSFRWSLNYDPQGNDGDGVVTAMMGEHTAICNLDGSHKQDGATFTHFAGGEARGELGGQVFRGDCRYPEKMAKQRRVPVLSCAANQRRREPVWVAARVSVDLARRKEPRLEHGLQPEWRGRKRSNHCNAGRTVEQF